MKKRTAWLACIATSLALSGAYAQCGLHWQLGDASREQFNSWINTMLPWDPDGPGPQPPVLVAGGAFTSFIASSGTVTAPRLALWNGISWQPMGTGVGETFLSSSNVFCLAVYHGELYAGGHFTTAGTAAVNHIVRWDGTAWQSVGGGVAGDSSSLRGVHAMGVWNDQLYVGGFFASAGGVPSARIASWDGSQWHAVTGLRATATIRVIRPVGDKLFVAGDNMLSSGSLKDTAFWDGAAWTGAGTFTRTGVYCATEYAGKLYVGGDFDAIDSASRSCVAVWDGAAWGPVGVGVTKDLPNTPPYVYAMSEYDNQLYASGTFFLARTTSSQFVLANGVARWDGAAWSAVDEPAIGGEQVLASATFGSELVLGGQFVQAHNQSAVNWARLTATGAPWVADQPDSIPVVCGDEVSLTALPAAGYNPVSYQWQRDGLDLADGATGTGSSISGATSGTLVITNVSTADGAPGGYACVIANACGGATSDAAELLMCVADYDCNNFVNGDDFDLFVADFELGLSSADVDHNSFVNGDDFDYFVERFEAGC